MRYAASLRYAGLLIAAEDADYSSFRNLGLLCPNCHESVFLVGPAERQEHPREYKDGKVIQIKASKVAAYFAHRPDKEKSELERCELRSSRTNNIDIEKSLTSSRNQILKIFNRHLWNILSLCYKLNNFQDAKEFVKAGFKLVANDKSQYTSTEYYYNIIIKELVEMFRGELPRIHAEAEMFLDSLLSKSQDQRYVDDEALKNVLDLWRQSIEQKMHVEIYHLAADCLGQKKHLPILENFVVAAIYNYATCSAFRDEQNLNTEGSLAVFNRMHSKIYKMKEETVRLIFQRLISLDNITYQALGGFVRDDILETIALTPWTDAFEKFQI